MNIIKKIIRWLSNFFRQSPAESEQRAKPGKILAPIRFATINAVAKSPKNEDIEPDKLYCVVTVNKPKWLLFRCPCNCDSVITLSLQAVHNPRWRVSQSDSGRPTLYPSVWRDNGCLSHFWIKDGRVNWCQDTGTHPDLRDRF